MGVTQRLIQVVICISLVAERPAGEARHSANVSSAKGDLETVGGGIRQAVYAVRPEVMVLPLLPVRDHRRAGSLELLDRVPRGLFVKVIQARVSAIFPGCDRLN